MLKNLHDRRNRHKSWVNGCRGGRSRGTTRDQYATDASDMRGDIMFGTKYRGRCS
jgi:hypothetical protein